MPGGDFFEQFIDDYYAECDEHLATLRRVLLTIDSGVVSAPQLHELTRALHTLKGLSGMVGLAAAEEVAHAMEETIRAFPPTDEIDAATVELLFGGERLLAAAIDDRRAGREAVSVASYVEQVRSAVTGRLHSTSPDASTPAAPPLAAGTAIQLARTPYVFEFVSSPELARRGIGVETIRQRLQSLGDIVATAPHVRASGGVVFEFKVIVRDGAAPHEAWRADGLTWTREDEARPQLPVVHGDGERTVPSSAPASNVVRVDLNRLDDLMRLVGDLVVARSRLGDSLARIEGSVTSSAWDDLLEANERIERQLRTIREGVMRIRLVPVGEVFERMRFAMRDIAREAGKQIRIEFSGQETELDKLVVDRMLEPLLHLVRNSASHGIESPREREREGKSPIGTIHLRARTAGDRVLVEVEDDGAGIDVARVAERAAAAGLISEGSELLPDALLEVICTPGFSTRDAADMGSGRGVGMAVVRTTIRALGGELFVHSVSGLGTRFTVELPLTLMITDALIVEIGDQAMAIPQIALREIVRLDESAVTRFEKNEVLSYRGQIVPLVDLSELFVLPTPATAARHVLIVGGERHLAGLIVDRLLGLREIVVHPISDPLIAVPGVSGATELADGRVSLILDAAALVRTARDPRSVQRAHLVHASTTARLPGEHTWS